MRRLKLTPIKKLGSKLSAYPKLNLLIKFAIVFGIFLALALQKLDPDFGWHLQAGNHIRQWGIPSHDIFTYTAPNFKWIDHEWAANVLASFLYQHGGYVLLGILYSLLWTVSLALIGLKERFLIILLATVTLLPYAGVRAVTWGVFFFTLLLKLLANPSRRNLLLTPLLFLVWANFHGSFVLGLLAIVFFAIKYRKPAYWYLLPICILVSFINPYGPRLYQEIARTSFDSSLHFEINEWHYFDIPKASILYLTLWGTGFWLFSRQRLANWLSLPTLLFAATMSATRNLPFFVMASLPDLESYYQKFSKEIPKVKKVKTARKLVFASLTAIVLGWCGYIIFKNLYHWSDREKNYPRTEVAYLKTHPCPGNLFNVYNFGGYLIWKLPGQPVYIDGRMPSWRDPSGQKYISRYFDVLDETKDTWKSEFQKYNIKCALLDKDGNSSDLVDNLKNAGWKTISNSNAAQLMEAPK